MDMQNAFQNLNWLAILLASLSAFFLGFLGTQSFSPGGGWKENGFTEESLKNANMIKIFGLSFLLMVFAAFILAMFLGHGRGMGFGAMAGFHAGIGWVFTFMGISYLFEKKITCPLSDQFMLFGGESDNYGAHYRADAIKPQRFGGAGVVTMKKKYFRR